MTDLIKRLEEAAEGSRELDCAISMWLIPLSKNEFYMPALQRIATGAYTYRETAAYSQSLDAAVSLVPEGYAIDSLFIWKGHPASVTILGTRLEPFGRNRELAWVHSPKYGVWKAKAATPALALCIAAIRARSEG